MPGAWQPGEVDPFQAALIEEATRRSGVIWITAPGGGPCRPAWHIWHAPQAANPRLATSPRLAANPRLATSPGPTPASEDPGHSRRGAAYVVTGTGEQALPGLADGRQATVTVPSKDSRGRLITWTAQVSRIAPGSDEWGEVACLLATRRRAGAAPPAGLPERWAAEAAVFRLSPVAGTVDAGTPDAGTVDYGTPDAGIVDAGTADAGTADAGTVDAGPSNAGTEAVAPARLDDI